MPIASQTRASKWEEVRIADGDRLCQVKIWSKQQNKLQMAGFGHHDKSSYLLFPTLRKQNLLCFFRPKIASKLYPFIVCIVERNLDKKKKKPSTCLA